MGINEKAWHVGFKWTIGNEDVPAGAIAVDNTSKQLHICDIEDAGTDWAVGVDSYPSVYIHDIAAPATDYVKIYHNGTNGIIDCDGTTILTMTATTLAISVDTAISGDLDLLTEDISVTTGKYIYLDGASGNDFLRASTDNNVILNGQTTVKLGIAGTAEVSVSGSALYPETDDGQTLGIQNTNEWSDLFLASAGVIGWDNNDVTITHASNLLTIAGGGLTMGASGTPAGDFILWPTTALYKVWLDVDGDTNGAWFFGADDYGIDVSCYGQASGVSAVWDASDGALELVNSKISVLATDDKTAAVNAVYAYIDTGGTTGWSSGNVVAGRFKVNVDHTAGTVSDLTAGWFGLNMAAGYVATQTGLRVAVNIEGGSAVANAPTSLLYLQSLPGASADFSDMPYMVFSETRGGGTGTGSRYLFEVGSAPASKIPTIGTGECFYQNTLQIAVNETTGNRTSWYLALSSAEASYTTAYPIASTSDTGYRCTATLVPDSAYADYAIGIGLEGAANELDVTFANSSGQDLSIIQMNINCLAVSTGPTGSSQMNLMHTHINHDTADMTNLRLKCADFTVNVAKDAKDAYAYQGEIDITDAAIGSEAGVMGLVLSCPSGTVTGALRGLIVEMSGASMPSTTSTGMVIRANTSATLFEGLRIYSLNGTTISTGLVFACSASGNITAAISCFGDGMANIVNFINAPNLTGCFDNTGSIGSQVGRILVNWGGTQRAVPVYAKA